MRTSFLVLIRNRQGDHIYFAKTEDQLDSVLENVVEYRLSPIFPVCRAECKTPDLTQRGLIAFLTFEQPYRTIGEILAQSPPRIRSELWFNCGLPSLVVFSSEQADIDSVVDHARSSLRALEIWAVDRHKVTPHDLVLSKPAEFDQAAFAIEVHAALGDYDLTNLLLDIRHGVRTVVALAAQHRPRYLEVIRRIVKEVNLQSQEIPSVST